MRFVNGRGIGVAVFAAALVGCGTLLGLDEYEPQTCTDGEKGEGEADVDCGGICGVPCGDGKGCGAAKDCASLVCGASGRCEAASCEDGVKNGNEGDLDCGGSCGSTCGPGAGCQGNGDCVGGACEGGVCAPTCTDKAKSGDESDVDCGGSCGATCGPEADCKANGDCVGGACEGGVCAPTCTDKAKSGDESDVDCGGPTCDACELGQGCATAGDCKSGVCHAEGCVAEHVWSVRFGDAQEQTAVSVVVDGAGNIIVAGALKGIVDFGGGPLTTPPEGSYFVTKRDPAGNHLWSKLFGEPDVTKSINVAVDLMGSIFIACTSASGVDFGGGTLGNVDSLDMYMAKLDSKGNHVWSKAFTSMGPDRLNGIQATSEGTIIISGEFFGAITFGGGILINNDNFVDIFVAELKDNGDHIWSKSYQVSTSLPPFKMRRDGAGNIILAGSMGGAMNFGGNILMSAGGLDIFVAKLDPFGLHIWSKRFGSMGSQALSGMSIDTSGNVLIGGNFNASFDLGGSTLPFAGGNDAFVAKLGPSGDHIWSKAFGDAADQQVMAIAIDGSDKLLLVGQMSGTTDYGGGPLTAMDEDIFLVELTSDNAHVWSRLYSGSDAQIPKAIATDNSGNAVIVGEFKGFVDFGGVPLVSAGLTDIFTAKLAYP